MRALLLLLSVFTGCATLRAQGWGAPPPGAASVADEATAGLIAEGEAAWARRADRVQLELAIAHWEAAATKVADAELYTQLARAHFLLGDAHLSRVPGREVQFERGFGWASEALKIVAPTFAKALAGGAGLAEAAPLAGREAVPALYWFAANLGKWGVAKGWRAGPGLADDARAVMDRVRALDPRFFYEAPARYLGVLEAVNAGLAGGSLQASEDHFRQAVAGAPAYLGNRVLWAEFLCAKRRDRAAYKRLLLDVLAADADADPAIAPENHLEQRRAKQLLDELDARVPAR